MHLAISQLSFHRHVANLSQVKLHRLTRDTVLEPGELQHYGFASASRVAGSLNAEICLAGSGLGLGREGGFHS